MNSLVDYGSDSDSGGVPAAPTLSTSKINTAPDVLLEDEASSHQSLIPSATSIQKIQYNLPHASLSLPLQGPANPFVPNGDVNTTANLKRKNLLTGFAEEAAISNNAFNVQQRTWTSLGYARNPSGVGYVGDVARAQELGGRDVLEYRPAKKEVKAIKKRRMDKGDVSVVDGEGAYLGPWAPYKADIPKAVEPEEDEEEYESEEEAPESNPVIEPPGKLYEDVLHAGEEKTEFHGESMYDYMGRTYMHVPRDLGIHLDKDPGEQTNYIPKKLLYEWKDAHDKRVTALRVFPKSGHLLLSSGADGKVKLWDVYHDRALLRSFTGHTKAVTDITFNNAGTEFLSASYDRQMKLWDTETGQCKARFTTGKVAHVLKFNPDPTLNHEFLAGMSDKKIMQFDTRTKEVVQEYDYHLGPVNTLTFVDENRRFISTSDDKSLRAWEYGLPVPITLIAEPYMYAMNRAALHPTGKYVAFQSGDNQIVVHSTSDKFRQNRKKAFRGHNNAGYAIDLDISPDGQFLMSGDSGGWICFWSWKSGRMYHKMKAAEGAVLCCAWMPQETSKVVTAGLEGSIKLWD